MRTEWQEYKVLVNQAHHSASLIIINAIVHHDHEHNHNLTSAFHHIISFSLPATVRQQFAAHTLWCIPILPQKVHFVCMSQPQRISCPLVVNTIKEYTNVPTFRLSIHNTKAHFCISKNPSLTCTQIPTFVYPNQNVQSQLWCTITLTHKEGIISQQLG